MCKVPLQYLLNTNHLNRTLLEYFMIVRRGPIQRPLASVLLDPEFGISVLCGYQHVSEFYGRFLVWGSVPQLSS